MCSVRGVCSSLCPIRPIWSHCIGAHTYTHVLHNVCAHSNTKIVICKCRALNLLLKNSSCNFYHAPAAKTFLPTFSQTKGHVCGRADISTSLSLTHSLQRQRLCLVTHRDSVRGSAAWCEPVLPEAAAGEDVFFILSLKQAHTHTYIIYNIYLSRWCECINSENKAQMCHVCERGTFPWQRQVGGPGQLGASLRSVCVWCEITRRRWVVGIVTP